MEQQINIMEVLEFLAPDLFRLVNRKQQVVLELILNSDFDGFDD